MRILGGKRGPKRLALPTSEGVPPELEAYPPEQFLQPQRDWRHVADSQAHEDLSFSDELTARGYDLSKFRLSGYLKGAGPCQHGRAY